MITVHHLENSRSQRILWLLEELELNYELKCYQRDPQTLLAPQALKEVHPLGKSPVITDGDVRGMATIRYCWRSISSCLEPLSQRCLIHKTQSISTRRRRSFRTLRVLRNVSPTVSLS